MSTPKQEQKQDQDQARQSVTVSRASAFRTLLRRAVLMSPSESKMLDLIPDLLFDRMLDVNFEGNMSLAERVLLNKYDQIDQIDRPALEQKKRAIYGLNKSVEKFAEALKSGKKVLVLTDNDNDGSMAQAVYLDFESVLPPEMKSNIAVAYAQPIGTSRGLNKENVDMQLSHLGWDPSDVLVITADIGINNRVEQEKLLNEYPGMELIVTDHHLPVEGSVVLENDRTLIMNPQYKPTEFFKKKNISGASTFSVLATDVIKSLVADKLIPETTDVEPALSSMRELSSWSDLLDYVNAHLLNMPLRPHTVEKSLHLRALMNVYNSMGLLVDINWSEKEWSDFSQALPGIDVDLLKNTINDVKKLNIYAGRLLSLLDKTKDYPAGSLDESLFYELLSAELASEEPLPSTGNKNYIAQLRPHVFRLSANSSKDPFFDALRVQMISVYDDLRSLEKDLVSHLRTNDILNREKTENSSIVYPKHPGMTKIIGRKMINKIYNEENNGFILTADSVSPEVFSGSMRSLYPISDIIKDKPALEDELGVDIEIMGHANAAGFKVKARQGTVIDNSLILKLNNIINSSVSEIKTSKAENLPFLSIDFGSFGLVRKINTAVKAHLSGMNGLPCVLKLPSPTTSGSIHVMDPSTSKQVNLNEVIANRKYGYQPIATDFHGSAFIIPIELIRSLSKQKFAPLLKLSYMDDGVMIAHQIAERNVIKNVIEFKGDRSDQHDLIGYYWKTFKDGHVIPLSESDFKSSPYFRFNAHGSGEYDHWVQFVISVLEETASDVLCVTDTEGMGFGLPACFNIGGTNIKIKEDSGSVLPEAEFESRLFRDKSGQSWLLDEKSIKELVKEKPEDENCLKLFKVTISGSTISDGDFYWPAGDISKAIKVKNLTHKNGKVFFNRALDGFAFAYLVTNDDFAVTPEFENLTGIGNDMVKRFGMPTEQVDKELADLYGNMKNAAGKPAKIIFAAHNLPYDKGVISANFEEFNKVMDDHLLCDTARLSRQAKLAYDDTPVASFENIPGISKKIYFYDSPYSSYSLSTFLDRTDLGKNALYPDTSGKYILKFEAANKSFKLINMTELTEVSIQVTSDDLRSAKIISDIPNNSVKYSVERLSARAMIRNIILHDFKRPGRIELTEEEMQYSSSLKFFQDQYHFDNTIEENVRFFMLSDHAETTPEEVLTNVAKRFVEQHSDIQARFHDGWIYEKVLSLYEPSTVKISQDALDQVAYHTALPHDKIRKVLEDAVRFKQKYSLDHALVHEQHNNIRQHSTDGQGLSDTALESVLPGLLTIMKFYNPYTRSIDGAVSSFVQANIAGAMNQLIVKRDYLDAPAIDSFSMKQLQSVDRDYKTSLVKSAQEVWANGGWDGAGTPIKFKLGTGVIPIGSGIYGKPKRELTEEELKDSSDRLEFILLNEQMRTAATLSSKLSEEYVGRIKEMAKANDAKSLEHRAVLMDRFEKIDFMRRDNTVKAISKLLKKSFQGVKVEIPESIISEVRKSPDLVAAAVSLEATHHSIRRKMNQPSFLSSETAKVVSEFLEELAKRSADPAPVKYGTPDADLYDGSIVRNALFLPDLDIERLNPLKTILKNAGPLFFARALEEPKDNKKVSSPLKK